jgi:hypothetical protein
MRSHEKLGRKECVIERRDDMSTGLPRILAVIGAAVTPLHRRIQNLNLPAEMSYLRHCPRKILRKLMAVCDFLPHDGRQVLYDKPVTVLNFHRRMDARTDNMGFAKLFTGHLKKEELMAFRGDCAGILLITFPCL